MSNRMGNSMNLSTNGGCGCNGNNNQGNSRQYMQPMQPMQQRGSRAPYMQMDRMNKNYPTGRGNMMQNNNNSNNNSSSDCGCDRRRAMMRVYELGFVMVETVLFLDTHPQDAEALEYYCTMKEKYHEAVKYYTENFGPLQATNVECGNYWIWASTPLPWEMED